MTPILASTPALWYLARGSGAVSLCLLTLTVVLGIVTSARWATAAWPRFVVAGLHRNLSLLAVAFLGLHVASVVVDGYVPIRWLDAVVPFASAYRPLWLGLGAVALDLLLAVLLTSLLRVHLGHRAWRGVHWAAYACWPVALVHGFGIGSDHRQLWMLAIDVAALAAVTAATCWRLTVTAVPAGPAALASSVASASPTHHPGGPTGPGPASRT
jgi:methionine sulfoxide reductase heme-binding subunit